MNLERVSNEEKLNLCRKYYLGGFAFLPFLWLVNIFWFFREAFLVPAYTEQSQIKGYVWRSAVGSLFWVIVLTTWITIFQIYRPRWGALGDYLSFTIPLGTP
ncbi:gamma-secretase subunit PEN-2-like [Lycaon pictus]